jgi:hypothetical protein
MEFEAYVEQQGFNLADLTPQQRSYLEGQWRAGQNAAAAPAPAEDKTPSSYDKLMEEFRRDEQRERDITALAAVALKDHPAQSDKIDQIVKLAMAGKWSAKDTELALLRGLRAPAPSMIRRGGREVSQELIVCALAQTGGLPERRKDGRAYFSDRVMEEAHAAFRGGLTLGEMLVDLARRNGHHDASLRPGTWRQTVRAAFGDGPKQVGFSSYSAPSIFADVANKFLFDGFNAIEDKWRLLTAIRSVNDFKEVKTTGLIGDYEFQDIAKDGTIPHAKPGDIEYSNKIKSKGRMLVLTEEDLINDDLGAFTGANRKVGRGGALALNKDFWTEYNRLADFNTAGNGNYDDGADTAFGADSLVAADLLFRGQKDYDGNPLGVRPRLLVVGPKNNIPALRLMRSQKVLEDSNAGDENVLAGMFTVVDSDYFADTALGGTAVRWALQADPNDLPVIEVAFLRGVQTPTVEEGDVDFDRLGIGIRGVYRYGVRRQEKKARVVMKGEA